jgi:hypothetical protein
MLTSICLNKLDSKTREFYENCYENEIITALIIGHNVITSKHYANINEENRNNFMDQLDNLQNELILSKESYEELETKKEGDNRLAIEVGLEEKQKVIELLEKHNCSLTTEKTQLRENLEIKEREFNELKCKMSTSKTKGEMTEKNIREIIETNGYICEKPGNHAGDLWVYSTDKRVICVLEIKNYGEENKNKLGQNGSQTKKMYDDIETQLNSDNTINVPWIFVSMGCEIPNVEKLRKTHLGVDCKYLSMPTTKELISWIEFCENINRLKDSKNDVNIIYIQQKINEIEEIFTNLLERKPNFKILKENVNKLSNNIDKEDKKYNKLIEDSVKRMNEINKSILIDNKIYDKEIDLTLNIDKLSLNEIKEYVKTMQSYSLTLVEKINNEKINIEEYDATSISNEENIEINIEEVVVEEENNEINKKKCEICGESVRNLTRHQKTNKCKSFIKEIDNTNSSVVIESAKE